MLTFGFLGGNGDRNITCDLGHAVAGAGLLGALEVLVAFLRLGSHGDDGIAVLRFHGEIHLSVTADIIKAGIAVPCICYGGIYRKGAVLCLRFIDGHKGVICNEMYCKSTAKVP